MYNYFQMFFLWKYDYVSLKIRIFLVRARLTVLLNDLSVFNRFFVNDPSLVAIIHNQG